MMLGGVICGYCAIGSVQTATAPANVMTMDSTAAKIGRSMKKRENKVDPQLFGPASLIRGGRHGIRRAALRWLPRLLLADFRLVADALQAAYHHHLSRLKVAGDDAHAVL